MNYKDQPFYKLALRFFFVFLVLFTIFKVVLSLIKTGSFSGMIEANFGEETFKQFLQMQLVLSAIYGVFMAGYYKFIKK